MVSKITGLSQPSESALLLPGCAAYHCSALFLNSFYKLCVGEYYFKVVTYVYVAFV